MVKLNANLAGRETRGDSFEPASISHRTGCLSREVSTEQNLSLVTGTKHDSSGQDSIDI